MSATLTWALSENFAKSGTAIGNFFTDLRDMILARAADAAYSWEVASSNVGSTPYQVTLKPKSGAAGRILIVSWSSGPAGNNSAILGGAPTASAIYCCYFPSGNVDTPSNLTASSGTIMGDDTNVIPCGTNTFTIASYFTTGYQLSYADCAEGIYVNCQNPSGATAAALAAGNLVVDANDDAYPCAMAVGGVQTFQTSNGTWAWNANAPVGGSSTGGARWMARYPAGASAKAYYQAWNHTGWAGLDPAASSTVNTDAANQKVWFTPVQLVGQVKGEGLKIKLRQITFGPNSIGNFTKYYTSGPVLKAMHMNSILVASAAAGQPWLTNFKV